MDKTAMVDVNLQLKNEAAVRRKLFQPAFIFEFPWYCET